jgi:hypothetical protein
VLVRGAEWVHRPIIYGLVDPLKPDVVRYVGQTVQAPCIRYLGHVSERSGWRRRQWIADLKKQGRLPDMVLLEEVAPGDDPHGRERHWIGAYSARGMADLNAGMPQSRGRTAEDVYAWARETLVKPARGGGAR